MVRSFEPDADGYLKVRLRRWKRKPRIGDWAILGNFDDDNIVLFAEIVAYEGERPEDIAVLTPTGGPYPLDDGWCDHPDW